MTTARVCLVLAALAIAACSTPLPPMQRTGLPVELRPSVNFDERRPNFVILHYTSNDTVEPALRTLTDRDRAVLSCLLAKKRAGE